MVSLTSESPGSTLTDGTEQTVIEKTTSKFFGGRIDLTNMQAGDQIKIKQYFRMASAGSYFLDLEETYTDVQDEKILKFPMEVGVFGYKITIQRLAGTDRTYTWLFAEAG